MKTDLRYDPGDTGDAILEKQLRAVAFLLESCSDVGNRPIDGRITQGLAVVLGACADTLARRSLRALKAA